MKGILNDIFMGKVLPKFHPINQKIIEKPWGYEIILGMWHEWRIKVLHVDKGHRTSHQYHDKKFEIMFFKDGHYKIIIPHKIHRLDGKDGEVDVLEISRGDDSDIVRLQDDYGRDKKTKPICCKCGADCSSVQFGFRKRKKSKWYCIDCYWTHVMGDKK